MAKYDKLAQDDVELEAGLNPPPSYDENPHAGSSSNQVSEPNWTNHISISRRSNKICGKYNIDTSIPQPPLSQFFPANVQAGSNAPNATFVTELGKHIELKLHVKGGQEANVIAQADGGGHIWVEIAERISGTPLNMAVSGLNEIKIWLPSSFRGPITGGSGSGALEFSPACQALGVTTFAEDQRNIRSGKYFIGQWEQGWDSSRGDRLTVLSTYGNITIGTWEEREEEISQSLDETVISWGEGVLHASKNVIVAVWGVVPAIWGIAAALWSLLAACMHYNVQARPSNDNIV